MRVLGIMSPYALGVYLKLIARSFVLDWFHFHSYIYICAGLESTTHVDSSSLSNQHDFGADGGKQVLN